MYQTDANGKNWLVSYANGVETSRKETDQKGTYNAPSASTATAPVYNRAPITKNVRGPSTPTGPGQWTAGGTDPLKTLRASAPPNLFRNTGNSGSISKYVDRNTSPYAAGGGQRSADLLASTAREKQEYLDTTGTHSGSFNAKRTVATNWLNKKADANERRYSQDIDRYATEKVGPEKTEQSMLMEGLSQFEQSAQTKFMSQGGKWLYGMVNDADGALIASSLNHGFDAKRLAANKLAYEHKITLKQATQLLNDTPVG